MEREALGVGTWPSGGEGRGRGGMEAERSEGKDGGEDEA